MDSSSILARDLHATSRNLEVHLSHRRCGELGHRSRSSHQEFHRLKGYNLIKKNSVRSEHYCVEEKRFFMARNGAQLDASINSQQFAVGGEGTGSVMTFNPSVSATQVIMHSNPCTEGLGTKKLSGKFATKIVEFVVTF